MMMMMIFEPVSGGVWEGLSQPALPGHLNNVDRHAVRNYLKERQS
jgi:hypothetical protein